MTAFLIRRIRPGGREQGFTLLEVMIAVCLLALGVVPLLVTHSNTIRAFARSKEVTYAALLAEEQMAEIEAQGFPEPFTASGEMEDPIDFNWEVKVTSLDKDVMVKAIVNAARGGDEVRSGKKVEVALTTYITNLEFVREEEEEESKE